MTTIESFDKWYDEEFAPFLDGELKRSRQGLEIKRTVVGEMARLQRKREFDDRFCRMNPDVKEKWLRGLSHYRQTQGALCKPLKDNPGQVGYCCMGVLADTIAPAAWNIEMAHRSVWVRWLDVRANLPFETLDGVGLDLRVQMTLTNLNDNGASFTFIRKVINALY